MRPRDNMGKEVVYRFSQLEERTLESIHGGEESGACRLREMRKYMKIQVDQLVI